MEVMPREQPLFSEGYCASEAQRLLGFTACTASWCRTQVHVEIHANNASRSSGKSALTETTVATMLTYVTAVFPLFYRCCGGVSPVLCYDQVCCT